MKQIQYTVETVAGSVFHCELIVNGPINKYLNMQNTSEMRQYLINLRNHGSNFYNTIVSGNAVAAIIITGVIDVIE